MTTVIVGRNNTGKTSTSEVFRRLLGQERTVFAFEDFSPSTHESFVEAYLRRQEGMPVDEVRAQLPFIELTLEIEYSLDEDLFGTLTDFIIELDDQCNRILVSLTYEVSPGKVNDFLSEVAGLDEIEEQVNKRKAILGALSRRIQDNFGRTVRAVDPTDPTHSVLIEQNRLQGLCQVGLISAQRGLDDDTFKSSDKLSKILESLFKNASGGKGNASDKEIAMKLQGAVESIQAEMNLHFNTHLDHLFPTSACLDTLALMTLNFSRKLY